jgi:hypothetical protein
MQPHRPIDCPMGRILHAEEHFLTSGIEDAGRAGVSRRLEGQQAVSATVVAVAVPGTGKWTCARAW